MKKQYKKIQEQLKPWTKFWLILLKKSSLKQWYLLKKQHKKIQKQIKATNKVLVNSLKEIISETVLCSEIMTETIEGDVKVECQEI